MIIGYQASHEQFTPSELLTYSRMAEHCGFQAIHCSDHFHPWSERQGQSGFAFAWLGAAMQGSQLPFGSVCAPGQRYHPAIVAQAVATLGQMFPGRYWVSLGSGEALNERITGDPWPSKAERQQRLKECALIIRRLLQGETVSFEGTVKVENACLYTRPEIPPRLFGAAVTKETAAFVAGWADGMITVTQPEIKEVIEAFKKNGGAGKPVYVKAQLSFAHTEAEAFDGAFDQWRNNIFSSSLLGDLWQVKQFDALGDMIDPKQLYKMIRISSDLDQHVEWIRQDKELGIDGLILHNVNRQQEYFIKSLGPRISTI